MTGSQILPHNARLAEFSGKRLALFPTGPDLQLPPCLRVSHGYTTSISEYVVLAAVRECPGSDGTLGKRKLGYFGI